MCALNTTIWNYVRGSKPSCLLSSCDASVPFGIKEPKSPKSLNHLGRSVRSQCCSSRLLVTSLHCNHILIKSFKTDIELKNNYILHHNPNPTGPHAPLNRPQPVTTHISNATHRYHTPKLPIIQPTFPRSSLRSPIPPAQSPKTTPKWPLPLIKTNKNRSNSSHGTPPSQPPASKQESCPSSARK